MNKPKRLSVSMQGKVSGVDGQGEPFEEGERRTIPDPNDYARNLVLNLSEAIARRAHGDDIVDAAKIAFVSLTEKVQDALLNESLDPWEAVVQHYKAAHPGDVRRLA